MESEQDPRSSLSRNPFIPDAFDGMTAQRRRSYALRLTVVRDKLVELLRVSEDGQALALVIAEVEAALAVLSEQGDSSNADLEKRT